MYNKRIFNCSVLKVWRLYEEMMEKFGYSVPWKIWEGSTILLKGSAYRFVLINPSMHGTEREWVLPGGGGGRGLTWPYFRWGYATQVLKLWPHFRPENPIFYTTSWPNLRNQYPAHFLWPTQIFCLLCLSGKMYTTFQTKLAWKPYPKAWHIPIGHLRGVLPRKSSHLEPLPHGVFQPAHTCEILISTLADKFHISARVHSQVILCFIICQTRYFTHFDLFLSRKSGFCHNAHCPIIICTYRIGCVK